jgi:hypothetical protein
MLTLLLICLLVGAVLGQRFKLLALIPAVALALAAAAGFTYSGKFWQILVAALTATTCLQIGYVAGVGIRYLTVAARITRRRGSFAASISPRRAAN